MVKLSRRIRMQRQVKTKGTTIKKGEIVRLVNFPITAGTYYTGHCTVYQRGYGNVRVPKSAIAKSVRKETMDKFHRRKK